MYERRKAELVMFEIKKNNKVIVVHFGNILLYPPTLTVIENLLDMNIQVTVISENLDKVSERIKKKGASFINVDAIDGFSLTQRIRRRIGLGQAYKRLLENYYMEGDLIWVSGDITTRALGKSLLKKNYVLHIMELEQYCPLFKGAKKLKFPIDQYARNAKDIVVPEENRAYIQKIWWNLPKLPIVMPNKPYSIEPGELDVKINTVIEQMKNEERKIIVYLGVIDDDRNFDEFAEAIEALDNQYSLYMFGAVNSTSEGYFNEFLKRHNQVVYGGFFKPPTHLALLKYAYIGILPYYVNPKREYDYQINALYCAPNKIYEYAGWNVPMIGTNVLGLKWAFEKYDIGICAENMEIETLREIIERVDKRHEEMKSNCKRFYDSVDLKQILANVIASDG